MRWCQGGEGGAAARRGKGRSSSSGESTLQRLIDGGRRHQRVRLHGTGAFSTGTGTLVGAGHRRPLHRPPRRPKRKRTRIGSTRSSSSR